MRDDDDNKHKHKRGDDDLAAPSDELLEEALADEDEDEDAEPEAPVDDERAWE